MAQGKLKVKAKMPTIAKKKNATKGPAVSKRANRPIAPKKKKFAEIHKLKKMVTKNVNHAVEEEMRNRAYDGVKNLSKAQQAVVKHHKNMTTTEQNTKTAGGSS